MRHGGEAEEAKQAYWALGPSRQALVIEFLNSLILFGPPDTSSNLEPADPTNPLYPTAGRGSINLTPLFNDPSDKE